MFMNQLHKALSASAITFAAAFLAPSQAVAKNDIVGRVRDLQNDLAYVCFYSSSSPAVGQTFQLERHVVSVLPKGETTLKSESVGAIRIVSLRGSRCASARVDQGSIRAADWVLAPSSPERH